MTVDNGALEADVAYIARRPVLIVRATDAAMLAPFEGTASCIGDDHVLTGPATGANAAAVRDAFPHLRPRPLGRGVSAGVGDRLGTATAGHVRAFARYGHGVTPVFAQQSFREMDRLHRTPQQVLDDATFGCVAGGWTGAVGADADHIRTARRIDEAAAAGFTTFTLDPGDAVRDVRGGVTPDAVDAVDWPGLDDDAPSLLRRYADVPVDLGARVLHPSADDVLSAVVKYGDAVALTARMQRRVARVARGAYEIEVAIDETDAPTSLFEHHFIASELERLGVEWVSMAPRYADGFQKGIEYIGDVDALAANFAGHRAVAAQHGDYKLSVHSGSDKFSIYESVIAAVDGRIHLKTSGTTWLVALAVVARRRPDLFRRIYAVSRDAYAAARASYQVSSGPAPDAARYADGDLEELVHLPRSRQLLHVGYGAVLTAPAAGGQASIDDLVRDVLADHRDEYLVDVRDHIGRHLAPFSAGGKR